MDGRRQEEVICLRRLPNRQIAKAKAKYRGLIEKYNQIPISFFWTITVCSGISALHLILSDNFQRSESLHQCVLEQQLCYLRTWMLLCFTELSNRQCFRESQGKFRVCEIVIYCLFGRYTQKAWNLAGFTQRKGVLFQDPELSWFAQPSIGIL